jgi:hypothetical protein
MMQNYLLRVHRFCKFLFKGFFTCMAIASPLPSEPQNASEDQKDTSANHSGGWLRGRALFLAVLLAPFTAYWAADQLVNVIFSLLIPPVVMTLLVAFLNLFLRRVAPRFALTVGDLIIFYGMHTVLCAICAEWMWVITPYIHSYAVYRDSDSRFDRYMIPYMSDWFFVPPKDARLFDDYRDGGHDLFYFFSKLPLWGRYIGSWTFLLTLICTAMLCINSLMRDEWANREKLAFPIIQVPLEIARFGAGQSKVWKRATFYMPFIIMFLIDMLNGFQFLYPSLPRLTVRYLGDLSLFFPNPPLNAIGWTPIGIFPYMAVIGFFMPTDLLFSCIFFFFFRKGVQVFTYSLGYVESAGVFGGGGLIPAPPYFSEQSWGAFLGLFVTSVWVARSYLREVWAQIRFGHPKGEGGVPHRVAFIGLLVSLFLLFVLTTLIGIPLWMSAFSTVLFLIFSVALTRMRAQIGAPSHEMAFMGPNQMLADFIGTQALPEAGVSRLVSTFFMFNRIHRTHPMPHQLEVLKMGEAARISQRALFVAIILAVILGSVLGNMVYIFRGYRWAASRAGGDTAGVIASLMEQKHPPNFVAMSFVVIGFLVVMLLDFMRFRIPNFPLHPAGYALAMNFGLDYFWMGLIAVWLIKLFVERYYGLKGHTKLHDVALGIIVAEFLAEAIWATYAMVTHSATYTVSINGRLNWQQ